MLRNHLRTAIRNFKRNTVISIINLLGLSIGLATCLVAGLYIKHELSADQFHRDIESIYRITVKLKEYDMNGTPYLFTETAQKEIPGIGDALRTANEQTTVRINNELYNREVVFADPSFFNFFTIPMRYGNPSSVLMEKTSVVISQQVAAQYFPDQNPVGKAIQIKLHNEFKEFEITGVAAQTPAYSSIHFDFLVPLDNRFGPNDNLRNSWGAFFLTTFVKVPKDQMASVQRALPEFTAKYTDQKKPDGTPEISFIFNPFAKHHLNEGYEGGGLYAGRNARGLIVFGGIAMIILLLACFNFMNLTNAQSSRRAVEVGIRKVVGALKAQLIRQFLTEALLLSCCAALIALGIAELSLILFGNIIDADLTVFSRTNVDVLIALGAITVIAGLLAGAYPAFVLSNLSTLKTFKRYFKIGGSNYITRSVLTLQFGLSIVLIVAAIVMWKQQSYLMNKDLGYNKEQLLVVPFPPSDTGSIGYIREQVAKLGETVQVSEASGAFTRGNAVAIQKMPDGSRKFIFMMSADEHFIKTMEMKLVKGRGFTSTTVDDGKTILINETLLKEFNLEDSIGMRVGRRVGWLDKPWIAGVVKDFNFSSLKGAIQPMVIMYKTPINESYLFVRLAKGQLAAGVEDVRSIWEKTNTNSPFEYFFLDDDVDNQYQSEMRWSSIITIGTGMAIFLSVLGLVGLSMFTAEQRKKEIGIRKVLGATLGQIIGLLSKDYLWLIAVAFVLAIPTSYYVMQTYWLDNFEYRIEITTVVYLFALALVLLIALVAIGSQTIKAALQNPANTLKEE